MILFEKLLEPILYGLLVLASLGFGASAVARSVLDRDTDTERTIWSFNGRRLRRTVIGLAAGLTVLAATVFVPAGHRGVVFDQGRGVLPEALGEGLGFIIPFWQQGKLVDIRTRVYAFESFAQSKDLQEITLPIAVNYSVAADRASDLYQRVGNSPIYETTIIEPAVFQATTQAVGQVEAADVAQSRAILADSIGAIIRPQLEQYGIVLQYVSIKDAVFDKDFIAAIKAKVIASEKAQEQANLVAAAQSQAQQVREQAAGDADALRAIADAQADANRLIDATLTPQMIEWQRLVKWNGVLPTTVVGESGDASLLLQVK